MAKPNDDEKLKLGDKVWIYYFGCPREATVVRARYRYVRQSWALVRFLCYEWRTDRFPISDIYASREACLNSISGGYNGQPNRTV